MKKVWSLNEIIFKLPLIDIKFTSSTSKSGESPANTENIVAYLGVQGVEVALRAFNGLFVTAELNLGDELIANRERMHTWEKFELFRLPDGKVALRACNGKYVGAKLHQHCQLVADLPHMQDWETFTLQQLPDGKFAFRAFNGLYVSACLNRDGELIADRPEASGWEAFILMLAEN